MIFLPCRRLGSFFSARVDRSGSAPRAFWGASRPACSSAFGAFQGHSALIRPMTLPYASPMHICSSTLMSAVMRISIASASSASAMLWSTQLRPCIPYRLGVIYAQD